ncbi:glycosyltransferase [Rhodocyclus gracilis]|uniref:Glycosyltransferase n=1 Tax=Rhodocyclus tenuis TaxID=1066 RepID=A0A6L5K134_RHOTE|nr:glycosyltransferase [Rhodocyclus gracilis]MQY52560.1 glycosyltransferase [Rhodocyclus gracilis]
MNRKYGTAVLHTEWSNGWGGQERRILAEMVGMNARGFRQILACRPECRLGLEAEAAGIVVHHVPFRGKFDFGSINRIVQLIRADNVSLVNTHSGIDSWVGGMAARWAGVRLIRTRHLNLPLKRTPLNFVHYLPHSVVTCGEAMRLQLIAAGFPANEVRSIPTGIDFEHFRPTLSRRDARHHLGLSDDDFAIVMVGIIRGVKRHELAIRAFQQFRQEHPEGHLILAGDGPMLDAMKELAHELGQGEHVLFLGHRQDVPDVLAAADCFLLTSRSEGVPQAVTQALGASIPVVATRVGGVPELVHDGETGLLVEPESTAQVSEALARIAEDRSLGQKLGINGRNHVLAHYSLDAMLDATEKLYGELAGGAA